MTNRALLGNPSRSKASLELKLSWPQLADNLVSSGWVPSLSKEPLGLFITVSEGVPRLVGSWTFEITEWRRATKVLFLPDQDLIMFCFNTWEWNIKFTQCFMSQHWPIGCIHLTPDCWPAVGLSLAFHPSRLQLLPWWAPHSSHPAVWLLCSKVEPWLTWGGSGRCKTQWGGHSFTGLSLSKSGAPPWRSIVIWDFHLLNASDLVLIPLCRYFLSKWHSSNSQHTHKSHHEKMKVFNILILVIVLYFSINILILVINYPVGFFCCHLQFKDQIWSLYTS